MNIDTGIFGVVSYTILYSAAVMNSNQKQLRKERVQLTVYSPSRSEVQAGT